MRLGNRQLFVTAILLACASGPGQAAEPGPEANRPAPAQEAPAGVMEEVIVTAPRPASLPMEEVIVTARYRPSRPENETVGVAVEERTPPLMIAFLQIHRDIGKGD
jgi:hypothetical protein